MPYQITSIDPKKTCLLVIDMQNLFLQPDSPLFVRAGRACVPKMKQFIDDCRAEGMQIIYTDSLHREGGKNAGHSVDNCSPLADESIDQEFMSRIIEELSPRKDLGDIVVSKPRYSAFIGTDLDLILRTLKIENICTMGVCTDCCVFSTSRDADALNYNVALMSDLVGTVDYKDLGYGALTGEQMTQAMLICLNATTCHVMSTEDFRALPRI